jgi:subtilase family serine protease
MNQYEPGFPGLALQVNVIDIQWSSTNKGCGYGKCRCISNFMQNGMSVKFARRLFGGRFIAIACAVVFLPLAACAQSPGRQVLHGHVPEAVARFHLQPTGHLSATKHLNLAIGLPLRNQQKLDDLLQQIYDSASPKYHQYLTPEQFTEQFGPTEQDYQAVINFAQRNHLTVTGTSDSRLLLDVSGSVADIERAFQVTMLTYRHPVENREFYAPDAEPSVEAGVPVVDIQGLSDFSRPHPKLVKKCVTNAMPQQGSAPDGSGSYFGNDFRSAYVPDTTLTGAGQMVGLVEFDGFYSNDIVAYATAAGNGRTNIVIQTVLLDGYNGVPTTGANSGNPEVSLDIEMAMDMAPGLTKIVSFEAGTNGLQNDILNAMLADSNTVKNLSCSWGWSGGTNATTDNIFKGMAAQGQSFFNAAGDSDAFTTGASSVNGVDNKSLDNAPSSNPYITQVGGTTLTTSGAGGSWLSETVWNWGGGFLGPGVGSVGSSLGGSGGISSSYPIPSWQTNVSMASNGGSASFRNIPDVALTADNVLVVYSNGLHGIFGGTSCATPLWAGFTALINQQALAGGKPVVGFINPAIYSIGKSANYLSDFNDIVTGNNFWYSSTNNFSAVPGYDLCTGWGTPAGQNLIDALAGVSDSLAVAPGRGFVAIGPAGGPFTANAQNFSLTNSGVASLNWSLINTSPWLTASATGGTLTPGAAATNVTVSLNAAACDLSPGIYTADVWFTNQTSHAARERQFTLLVGQQSIQNGGFEYGVLSYWTQTGPKYSYDYDFVDNGSVSKISPHSGNYLAVFGLPDAIGYISQEIPTVPGQAYLLSFWLTNPDSGSTEQFLVNWNTNATTTNTILNLLNPGVVAWTNPVFVVTATSTNTVLQFGARNDPDYFGLDDVNVWPIPTPSFLSISKSTNAVTFTWNSLTSIMYQVQYKTNLLQTNWTNLGAVITATNFTVTATNSIGPDPQRFYRLQLLY